MGDFMSFVGKKLKGHFKSYSLVEMSENLLRHSANLNLLAEASPILVTLATEKLTGSQAHNNYNYQADEGTANKLKNLLSDLYNKLKSDSAANDKLEQTRQNAYNVYAAKLNAVISTLAKNIKRTEEQITRMTKCIDTENGVMATASAKFARNSALRNQASKMCSSFAKEFIEATRNRLDEIRTMGEIIAIVAKRFKKMPQDLVEYLESTKNGFKAYMNSTEFKKFIEYKQKQYVDNKRGAALRQADVTTADYNRAGHFVKKWGHTVKN